MQSPLDACQEVQASLVGNKLPFTVKVVRTESQLRRVCEVRALAYGRHIPAMGLALREPEPDDRAPGNVILIAEDKKTGVTVGTMRIHTNTHRHLPLQGYTTLPAHMQGQLLVEVCRFSVRAGYSAGQVRLALFKALYLYCHAAQAQYMVVAARKPLNEIYKSLGFKPLQGDEEHWVSLAYANDLAHSMLAFNVPLAEHLWQALRHPLYEFMRQTYHPDIQVFSAISSSWSQPRRAARDASNELQEQLAF